MDANTALESHHNPSPHLIDDSVLPAPRHRDSLLDQAASRSPRRLDDIEAQRNNHQPTTPAGTSRKRAKKKARPQAQAPQDGTITSYPLLVRRLAKHMPHLTNVQSLVCLDRDAGDIICYDSLESGGLPRLYDSISFREYKSKVANIAIRIDGLKPNKARNLRCRYLLVEDLSPRIIRWLGQTFWLNPEFFEEHLNASGYGRPGYGRQPYKDPSPSTWNTSAIPKDYISVRWFRPVHRSHMPPVTDADRLDLLNGKWAAAFYSLATNIFRKEWAIVSDPNRATSEYGTANAYPAVWEERATIHVSQVQGRPPIFIILLDPLPVLVDVSPRPPPGIGRVSSERSGPLPPFKQAYNRAPIGSRLGMVDVFDGQTLNEHAIDLLGSNIGSAHATRSDLISWLKSTHGRHPGTQMDMITGLMWIIHRDIVGFLYFVSTALEEIGVDGTDDYLLQSRLTHWRNLITQFQTELPAIRQSVKNFLEFIERFQPSLMARADFMQSTLDQINDLINQNEKSYAALRADMTLLESKRAIAQAESVGKLTELGFIFIPISCVASLFSMQIEPLETPAPLWTFIVTSIGLIGTILFLRLAIRSAIWVDYWRETAKNVRRTRNLPPGAPIPARIYAVHILGKMGGLAFASIVVLVASAGSLLPLIFLWVRNRHLDLGFKGALTAMFILLYAMILAPVLKRLARRGGTRKALDFLGNVLKRSHRDNEDSASDVSDLTNSGLASLKENPKDDQVATDNEEKLRKVIGRWRSGVGRATEKQNALQSGEIVSKDPAGSVIHWEEREGPERDEAVPEHVPPPALLGHDQESLRAEMVALPPSISSSKETKSASERGSLYEVVRAFNEDFGELRGENPGQQNPTGSVPQNHADTLSMPVHKDKRTDVDTYFNVDELETPHEEEPRRSHSPTDQLASQYQHDPRANSTSTAKGKAKQQAIAAHDEIAHEDPAQAANQDSAKPSKSLHAWVRRRARPTAETELDSDAKRSNQAREEEGPSCIACQNLGTTCSRERPMCYHCEATESICAYPNSLMYQRRLGSQGQIEYNVVF